MHEYQIKQFEEEQPSKKLFWAFMLYGLAKQVRSIRKHEIEENVTERRVWFFEWNWVKQFPVWNPETGPYRYIRDRDFPDTDTFLCFERNGGTLYLPEGTLLQERLINNETS